MRVVFFGTPAVAAGALEHLVRSPHQVAAVVTRPDRPRGRSGRPKSPPVKEFAEKHGIRVLQPETPRDPAFAEALASFHPDVGAVVAYGHILPTEVLAVPPRGFVNVHFSLLPRYRGAAPVQRALMAGESETGVTIFLLEPTMDTGPILTQERTEIRPEDDAESLLARLGDAGARRLVATLDAMEAGAIEPVPQDPALASPAPKIKPEDAAVDWERPAQEIVNLIRAMKPAPGAFTTFRGKRLKIWDAAPEPDVPGGGVPGELLPAGAERLVVATGGGAVRLRRVQLEGGKPLDDASFVRGHRPKPGERFKRG